LHTKAFIVDRKELFIGSFNFDPRSVNLNTELGVLIRDPALAEELAQRVAAALPLSTYQLKLDDRSRLRWHTRESGEKVVYTKEPKTSWKQRLVARIARVLPIHSQL
jgi:putative cardiolipin synthase